MKALQLTVAEGPASAALVDIERSEPAAGELRVAIRAAALNHRELWISRGQYPGMTLPCTLGCDGAGVVDAVGEGVDAALVGREVVLYPGLDNWGGDPALPSPTFGLLGMPGPGTVAEAICVPAAHVAPKPAHLDFDAAAAVPLAALTAWRGLVTKGGLQDGEKVLITGTGGGVATFAVKLAIALGARVYVTSGSDEGVERARTLGAIGGFNYKDPEWRRQVGKTTGGLDLVFDGAPVAAFPNYSRALNMGARVVFYGSTGGAQLPLMVPEVFLRNLHLIGTNVGNLDEFRTVLDFIATHRITPEIDRRFMLDEAPQALAHLDTAHGFGKVVIAVDG